MNADSPNRRISRPLKAPMARPTSRQIGIASAVAHSVPMPLLAAGMTSATASAGARPTVDSSERSNRPPIRMIASASTSSDSSVCCCSTLVMLALLRKTGSMSAPTRTSTMIAGTSARSRSRASRGPRQPPAWPAPATAGGGGGRSAHAAASLRVGGGQSCPAELACARFARSCRRLLLQSTPSTAATTCGVVPAVRQARPSPGRGTSPAPGRSARRSSSSSETISTAVPWSAADRTAPSSDSLERTSTPAVGLISTSTRGSVDSARASTTFCALPPERLVTGAAGPSVLDVVPLDHLLGDGGPPPRHDDAGRPEPVGDRQGRVLRHRQQRDEALAVPVLRAPARCRPPAPPARPRRRPPSRQQDRAGVGPAQPADGLGQRHLAAAARSRSPRPSRRPADPGRSRCTRRRA